MTTSTDVVDLGAERFAALVAPAITRAFASGMRAAAEAGGELATSFGGDAIGYLIDLRNPLAGQRTVSVDGVRAIYRYSDPRAVDDSIAHSIKQDLLARDSDGGVRATERGRRFLVQLYALHEQVLSERWNRSVVERLNTLVARAIAEGEQTSGAAWAVQAPPHEPPGLHASVVLLNRLSTLRYHRADAHAAAWQAAELTADDVAAMPWGTDWSEERREIERDTNARAAPPYAVLTPDERLAFLADLAALA